jgi:hypothetical protein
LAACAIDRCRLDTQHAATRRRHADGVEKDRARQAREADDLDARLAGRAPAPPHARAIAEHGDLCDARVHHRGGLGRPRRHHDARHLLAARLPGRRRYGLRRDQRGRGGDEREWTTARAQFAGIRASVIVRRPG